MLKTIAVKNFRKLTDHQFVFTPGLNIVRGLNEAGKSTMLEALKYAMFGIKSCRTPLAEMVTWGHPEASLSVTVVFAVEGKDYSVKRSKAGAELVYDGGIVTGQTEVTNFIAKLFKVDVNAISQLMLASQNSIRGALSDSDSKAAELIEQLSDLKVLDDLLEQLKAELPSGTDALAQSRLKTASDMLAATGTADTSGLDALRAETVATAKSLHLTEEVLAEQVKAIGICTDELTALETAKKNWEANNLSKQDALAKKAAFQNDLQGVIFNGVVYSPAEILLVEDTVARLKAEVVTHGNRMAAMSRMLELNESILGGVHWEGTKADFDGRKKAVGQIADTANKSMNECVQKIAVLDAQRIKETACGLCGKDLANVPEVVAKNEAISKQIEDLKTQREEHHKVYREATSEYQTLVAIQNRNPPVEMFLFKHADLMQTVDTTYPPTLEWTAAPLGMIEDVTHKLMAEESKLAKMREAVSEAKAVAVRQQWLNDSIAQLDAKLESLKDLGEPIDPGLIEAKGAELVTLQTKWSTTKSDRDRIALDLANLNQKLGKLDQAAMIAKTQKESLEATVQECLREIDTLAFNNALIKRVREVRPLISNLLWNKVLSAVNHYFGKMRGTRSLVTKVSGGFKVDGQSVAGLSGSTLDALGFAIRLALTKTFAPHVEMLIVDEPFAAMDEDRTKNSLGFLSTCGFKQIILVTHEEISMGSAANIINI